MATSSDIDLWEKVFTFVSSGCQNGLEHEWSYHGLQIYPIVKTQMLMRIGNALHASRGAAAAAPNAISESSNLRKDAGFLRGILTSMKRLAAKENDSGFALKPARDISTSRVDFQADAPVFRLDWPRLPEQSLRADILCLGYATNHKLIGDRYYQLCMEPIRLALRRAGISSFCLIAGLRDGDDGIVNSCASGVAGLEVEFRRARALAKTLPAVDWAAIPGFEEWWAEFESTIGDNRFVTKEHISNIVRETAGIGAWLHANLKGSNVKGVLVSAYYGLIGHGCSAAARALKLPIGDIQHGVAGRAHHAYSWPNAGNFGFNTLPGHFFCWSKKEAGEMSQLSPDWNPEMHVIGNVWALLDNVLDEKGSLEPIAAKARAGIKSAVQNARDEFATKKWDAEVNILLALHPEEQLPWLAELQAIAPAEWRLWIRLHPGDFKNDVARAAPWKHFEDERTEVVLPTKAPLNAVLAEIDIVLTKYSSVALDALAYGVPTVAYSDSATLFFGKLDKSELMICTPDAKSICAAIAQRVSSNDGGRLERQQPSDFSSMGLVIRDRFVNAFLPA